MSESKGLIDSIKEASKRKFNAKSKCAICRKRIIGKAWRMDDNRYACTACNNRRPEVN